MTGDNSDESQNAIILLVPFKSLLANLGSK